MPISLRSVLFVLAIGAGTGAVAPGQSFAQTAPVLPGTNSGAGRGPARTLGMDDSRDRVLQGRALLDENDPNAVSILREAAQSSLAALTVVLGSDPLVLQEGSLPTDIVTVGNAQHTAEAHLYWGLAADKFAQRDEALTALSRALRFAKGIALNDSTSSVLRRDTSSELGRVLRQGLPLVAPDDVLDAIAALAHGGLWKPRRLKFHPAGITLDPQGNTIPAQDFLITDGKVFPPVQDGAVAGSNLSRVPPLYTAVAADKLPLSLQMDKMVGGYVRELDGPNKGQWRQVARVFYASPFLTKNRRNDLPRAEALCISFLKVHALNRSMLGLSNLYARGDRIGGVTTVWLLEVSALWPNDEEDKAVLAQLGPRMPELNTGPSNRPPEPETTPFMRPWNFALAGQVDSSPGDILFWKAGLERSESEWLREVAHEYGHVALPPVAGFRPPLEPYGNGTLGETLVMLWAASNPVQLLTAGDVEPRPGLVVGLPGAPLPLPATGTPNADYFIANVTEHLSLHALPALNLFRRSGPNSPLRTSTNRENLRFLQGLTVYVDRVYGSKILGRAFQPLAAKAANAPDSLARRQLLNTNSVLDSLANNLKEPWGQQKTLKIWLPGAMQVETSIDDLVKRGPARLKAPGNYNVWLFVPNGTEALRIEGKGIQSLRAVGLPFKASPTDFKVYFAGKTGWQQFTLGTGGDTLIEGSYLEKK